MFDISNVPLVNSKKYRNLGLIVLGFMLPSSLYLMSSSRTASVNNGLFSKDEVAFFNSILKYDIDKSKLSTSMRPIVFEKERIKSEQDSNEHLHKLFNVGVVFPENDFKGVKVIDEKLISELTVKDNPPSQVNKIIKMLEGQKMTSKKVKVIDEKLISELTVKDNSPSQVNEIIEMLEGQKMTSKNKKPETLLTTTAPPTIPKKPDSVIADKIVPKLFPDKLTTRAPKIVKSNTKIDSHQPAPVPSIRKKGMGRDKNDGKWKMLKGTEKEIYVYSAFFDNRKSLQGLPVVRVITSHESSYKKDEVVTLYCHTYPKTSDFKVIPATRLLIGAGVIRHGKFFQSAIFTCKLNTGFPPSYIALTVNPYDSPSFYEPVEMSVVPTRQYYLGVCVSVSYGHHDVHRLIEWFEFQKLVGVSQVTVYNNSLSVESADIIKHYEREGFAELRQTHNFISDGGELTYHMHMSPSINDCMYRYMYKFKYIMVIDFDEMIVPTNHMTLPEMIPKMFDYVQNNIMQPGQVATNFMFKNVYFFLDLGHPDMKQSKNMVTLRHRYSLLPSGYGVSAKSIINPLACTNMHSHLCWGETPAYYHGPYRNLVEVPIDYGLLFHYKKCHFDLDECEKLKNNVTLNNEMMKYETLLSRQVNEAHNILNLA